MVIGEPPPNKDLMGGVKPAEMIGTPQSIDPSFPRPFSLDREHTFRDAMDTAAAEGPERSRMGMRCPWTVRNRCPSTDMHTDSSVRNVRREVRIHGTKVQISLFHYALPHMPAAFQHWRETPVYPHTLRSTDEESSPK